MTSLRNGEDYSNSLILNQYVRREEFIPVVDKVEGLLINQAVLQSTMNELVKNTAHIRDDMHKLVVHDALRTWVVKVSMYFLGTICTIITTMVTGHLTGLWKMIGHVFS